MKKGCKISKRELSLRIIAGQKKAKLRKLSLESKEGRAEARKLSAEIMKINGNLNPKAAKPKRKRSFTSAQTIDLGRAWERKEIIQTVFDMGLKKVNGIDIEKRPDRVEALIVEELLSISSGGMLRIDIDEATESGIIHV